MTTITLPRATVEQALEALEWHYRQGHSNTLGGFRLKIDEKALRALRAALAQQDEPRNQCGETCERAKLCATCAQALAQQAEPVEPVATLIAQRDALLEALKGMLHRDERNTCRHEETHRGGALWEICDSCGAMWADDEGGKPQWEDPKEWTQARAAIKAVKEGK